MKMFTVRRLVTVILILTVAASQAAASEFLKSAAKAAEAAAAEQRPAAAGHNPYKTPGIVLLSAGAGLALLSFLAPSGVSCEETSGRNFGIECGTSANKGLLFGGLGAMGVGGYLLTKKPSPTIQVGGSGIRIVQRISF